MFSLKVKITLFAFFCCTYHFYAQDIEYQTNDSDHSYGKCEGCDQEIISYDLSDGKLDIKGRHGKEHAFKIGTINGSDHYCKPSSTRSLAVDVYLEVTLTPVGNDCHKVTKCLNATCEYDHDLALRFEAEDPLCVLPSTLEKLSFHSRGDCEEAITYIPNQASLNFVRDRFPQMVLPPIAKGNCGPPDFATIHACGRFLIVAFNSLSIDHWEKQPQPSGRIILKEDLLKYSSYIGVECAKCLPASPGSGN